MLGICTLLWMWVWASGHFEAVCKGLFCEFDGCRVWRFLGMYEVVRRFAGFVVAICDLIDIMKGIHLV